MSTTRKQQNRRDSQAAEALKRDERNHRLTQSSGVVSVSSNTKWRKVLEILAEDRRQQLMPLKASLKLISDPEPFECAYLLESLFEDQYLEGMNGVFAYSDIEWIQIPLGGRTADLGCKVDYIEIDGELRIYGYRRTGS